MVFGTNSNKLLQEISTENDYLLLKSHLFLYHAATFQFRMSLLGNLAICSTVKNQRFGKKAYLA